MTHCLCGRRGGRLDHLGFSPKWPLPSCAKSCCRKPLIQRLERLQIVELLVSRDLLALHGGAPGRAELLGRFSGFQPRASDGGRSIVLGECLFGFVLPEGPQLWLTLHPSVVLRIPRHHPHLAMTVS